MSDIEGSIKTAYQDAVTALQDFLTGGDALQKTKEGISLIYNSLLSGERSSCVEMAEAPAMPCISARSLPGGFGMTGSRYPPLP